ncbi:MAG TPA: cupin domain-containing protein [Solirubrobacteraceae bacterium]|nr:cupin domain-containing protein [Solirubrobacteraceae bacterium]
MSHPDPAAAPDARPIRAGDTFENPVTRERAVLIEAPWWNDEGRAVADMTALPGARVVGEHLHPALRESFTVLEGELTVQRDGHRSLLRAGEHADVDPGVWHDWWNAGEVDALVRVEVTPGERFAHLIETLFGLAREGHVNTRGMPDPLQLALIATEFSDVIVFRKPPAAVQRILFAALAPVARRKGYRATYPGLSRTTLAPRLPRPQHTDWR